MACRLFQQLPHVLQVAPGAAQDMNGGLPKPIDESEVRLQYRSAIARLLWGARPSQLRRPREKARLLGPSKSAGPPTRARRCRGQIDRVRAAVPRPAEHSGAIRGVARWVTRIGRSCGTVALGKIFSGFRKAIAGRRPEEIDLLGSGCPPAGTSAARRHRRPASSSCARHHQG
jgi:hypothetical protein